MYGCPEQLIMLRPLLYKLRPRRKLCKGQVPSHNKAVGYQKHENTLNLPL